MHMFCAKQIAEVPSRVDRIYFKAVVRYEYHCSHVRVLKRFRTSHSGIDVELNKALAWVGAEAVIDPLVAGLISQ